MCLIRCLLTPKQPPQGNTLPGVSGLHLSCFYCPTNYEANRPPCLSLLLWFALYVAGLEERLSSRALAWHA